MNNNSQRTIRGYEQHIARKRSFLAIMLLAVIVVFVLYLGIGSMRISPLDVLRVFAGKGEARAQTAIMNVRLPRGVAAVLVGAILAASGAVMQCVLSNKLASASTLGVSQGAAFGAAIGIIVFGGGAVTNSNSTAGIAIHDPYIVSICAFFFGSLCSMIVILLSRRRIADSPAGMVLAGTALSAMFSGGSTLMQYFADDTSLGAVVFWTFGNLGNAGWTDLRFIFAVFVLSMIYFYLNRWNYNALSAGHETAKSLGVDTRGLTLISMAVCSLASAVAVSFVGIIGFVGLIAPHMVRFFTANDYRFLIPGSALAGGLLLLIADSVAKLAVPPIILPIGAIMSFVGGPVFLVLLFRRKHDKA